MNNNNECYFISSRKVNAKITPTVMEGMHIEIKGITYQQLERKPRGRSITRSFTNVKTNQKFIFY